MELRFIYSIFWGISFLLYLIALRPSAAGTRPSRARVDPEILRPRDWLYDINAPNRSIDRSIDGHQPSMRVSDVESSCAGVPNPTAMHWGFLHINTPRKGHGPPKRIWRLKVGSTTALIRRISPFYICWSAIGRPNLGVVDGSSVPIDDFLTESTHTHTKQATIPGIGGKAPEARPAADFGGST